MAPRLADEATRFAVRVCGSQADAEDAVQEALAALWKKHGEVEPEGAKPYLLGATWRQLMMLFRRRTTERGYTQSLPADTVAPANESFDLRDALQRSMQTLQPQQRAILELRDVQGYSYREIGELTGLTVDQVQVYLFRARVKMRKQLNEMGYGENQ